jgi:NhaA family Na+:H+ antiporter
LQRRALLALRHEFAAGITVGVGALIALSWSAVDAHSYRSLIEATWSVPSLRSAHLSSLRQLSVNGAMTIFFFAVGLELSKEFRIGTLRQRRVAVMPLLAAVGGMATCALSYLLIGKVTHNAAITSGWGVPMATDIAFTLGTLSLAGRGVPSSIRLFLLALAVADDLFAVVILAFSGHQKQAPWWLMGLVVVLGVGFVLRRRLSHFGFLAVLVLAWLTLLAAHVEPALAGVAVGVLVPFGAKRPGHHLEHIVQPWSNGFALPFFALCACGVLWNRLHWNAHASEIVIGLLVARLVGKMLGINLSVAVARRFGVAVAPGVSGAVLWGASALCAIGFTVPLLFAGSLYGPSSSAYAASTVGLLGASLLAALVGVGTLRVVQSRRRNSLS